MPYKEIDKRIAWYLRDNHMTQEEFAKEKLGMSSNSLSDRRRGKKDWMLSELQTLRVVLDEPSLDALIGHKTN